MELIIALSIIFSVVALFTVIYACEELMKLRNRTECILDLAQRIINVIRRIEDLEDRTKKED